MKNRGNLTKPLALAVLLLFLILLPLFVRGYWLDVLILLTINVILVVSFRLVTTMGGWNFAHIAMMGVGAYTSALLTTKYLDWPFWLTLPLGGLVAAFVALAISYPCLRTKGFYFFLSTFAAGEAMRQVWIRFQFFGGKYGICPIIHPNPILGIEFVRAVPNYYLALVITLLSVFIFYRLDKSRIGDTVKAINSDEELCEAMGINTWGYKALVFVVASFFAGIAGVLLVHYNGLINAEAFSVAYCYKIITATIIGGAATFVGPIIGLVVMTGVTEIFRDLLEWVPLIYGVFIIGVLLFLPDGLVTLPRRMSPLIKKIQMIGKGIAR